MKYFTLIFLASLIMGKVLLGSIFMYQLKLDPIGLERNAIASEPPKNSEGKTEEKETVAGEKDIDLDFLLKKQFELKQQEEALAKKKMELMTHISSLTK